MKRPIRLAAGIAALMMVIGLAGCAADAPTPTHTPEPTATVVPTATPSPRPPGPADRLTVEVLAKYPHDTTAFTEGLAIADGRLYESTGRYGMSALREIELESGKVLKNILLGEQYFGEGLAIYNQSLVQLTWKEKLAFTYDRESLAKRGQMVFSGEGWGLCFDGQDMIMSDGSDALTIRSPETFQAKSSLPVTLDGESIELINELECVGDSVYANVWHTDRIMRIERATGRVIEVIDASGLLSEEETSTAGKEGVLNGIAYDADRGVFLITGKNWPWLFEVRFVPEK